MSMQKPTSNLDAIGERIRRSFSEKNAARDRALQISRETIRHCANSIRAVHREEFDTARTLLATARSLLDETGRVLAPHGDLRHMGFVEDAAKEYAEGMATLALVTGEPLPEPEALGVSYAAYLNGLGEAVGELRRHLLDSLRRKGGSRGEKILAMMDEIYSLLVTIDFPDAITGGLRRTTDLVRGILEKTRGDLTLSVRQQELADKIEEFRGFLKGEAP